RLRVHNVVIATTSLTNTGMTMLLFEFHSEDLIMMAVAVPLVLLARFLSVWIPYLGFKRFRTYNKCSVKILTWGGLRGGLALAMALSIPSGKYFVTAAQIDVKEIIMVMTYAVVVFSILIQGSTITPMINKAKVLQKQMEDAEVLRSQVEKTEDLSNKNS
ncbi:cation:proton antiporter domain-containing protein, partial [Vibrio casei]